MENLMKDLDVCVDNLEFKITEVRRDQRNSDSSFLKERGCYRYTYYFEQISPFGENVTFDIDINDEKNNNKRYLREKCLEFYKGFVLSNKRILKVGDIV